MAKKLISYDDTKTGLGLPDAVVGKLSNEFASKSEALTSAEMTEAVTGLAKVRSGTVALLGDSISEMSSRVAGRFDDGTHVAAHFSSRGYWTWANIRLGHRLTLVKNAGVSGQRTGQIMARTSDVTGLPVLPEFCVVLAGTNDVTVPVPAATIISNLTSIYADLLAVGISVVAGTITPRTGLDAPKRLIIAEVNDWIKSYAGATPGIILCDWNAGLADPATGDPLPDVMHDGLHPSAKGAGIMGAALADALHPLVPGTASLTTSNADPTNLLANAMTLGTTGGKTGGATGENADGYSTIWPVAGAATLSKVPRTDGVGGEWQQVAFTGGGFLGIFQNIPNGQGWNPGDEVYGECEFETDAEGWDITRFQIRVYGQGTGSISGGYDGYADVYEPQPQVPSGVLRTPRFVIPENATTSFTFQVNARSNSTGTFRFSRASIKKVVKL